MALVHLTPGGLALAIFTEGSSTEGGPTPVQGEPASPSVFGGAQLFINLTVLLSNLAQQQNKPRRCASAEVVRRLPIVSISHADLNEMDGATCSVCLTDFVTGEAAIRLPCGHFFHDSCIKEWLKASNQCAVCRWELATDDLAYEIERKALGRRLRLRLSELRRRTVRELRFLAYNLNLKTDECIEKDHLVDCIVASGTVDIVAECNGAGERRDYSGAVTKKRDSQDPPVPAPTDSIEQPSHDCARAKRQRCEAEGSSEEKLLSC